MTAIQHQFKIGDHVEMTDKALQQQLHGRKNRRTGVIKKILTKPYGQYLTVHRDGMRSAELYSAKFWQHSPKAIADNTRYCPHCGQRLP